MQHVGGIADAGTWDRARAVDRVVLDADDRQRRRIVLTTEKGAKLLLDFPAPVMLRDGDGLVLDDRSIVVVEGRTELLLELSATAPLDLVRLAWHIGNRHTDVQFARAGLRIRRDHVLRRCCAGSVPASPGSRRRSIRSRPRRTATHHHD